MEKKLTPELIEKAKQAKSPEELLALAKENGTELTAEEANTYFAKLNVQNGELSDDELDQVAGGCGDDNSNVHDKWYRCEHYLCLACYNKDPNCRATPGCCTCKRGARHSENTVKCHYSEMDCFGAW